MSAVAATNTSQAKSVEGSLYYANRAELMVLLCKATPGKIEPTAAQQKANDASRMQHDGVHTIQSDAVSTRGPIWGFSNALQLLPQ